MTGKTTSATKKDPEAKRAEARATFENALKVLQGIPVSDVKTCFAEVEVRLTDRGVANTLYLRVEVEGR